MPIDILTPLSRKITIYSDLNKDLTQNPITGDIALKINEDAVKDSLRNLIMTDKGERLFQPELGSDVRKSLFDNMTPAIIKMLEQNVRNVINNFEPRATIVEVEVVPEYDNHRVKIKITFYVINVQTPVTVTVFLERIR